jgi:hypothetical protein
MPITTLTSVANINGYNFIIQYDKNKVVPTGNITVSNDLIAPFLPAGQNAEYITDFTTSINEITGTINIGIFFNSAGGVNAVFSGSGDVCCVEFVKTTSFQVIDTTVFSFNEIIESYQSSSSLYKTGSAGQFISFKDDKLHGSLKFWSDYSPIKYDTLNPNTFLITNILGCNQTSNAVQPDMTGDFTYSILNGTLIDIQRDIASTTSVHSVINAQDAYFTALVSNKGTYQINWTPSVFQMIAMDVNRDGMVTAGDASQINQRAVNSITEFSQIDTLGKDWSFIADNVLVNDLHYLISTTFPEDDGFGYSKYRVPVVAICQAVPVINATTCPIIQDENYIGVLIGDVDASYKTIAPDGLIKNAATVDISPEIIFDLSKATRSDGEISIPVSLISFEAVNSFDFEVSFNDHKAIIKSVENNFGLNLNWKYISTGNRLSLASYSITPIPCENSLSLIFELKDADTLTSSDLIASLALINGSVANLIDSTTQTVEDAKKNKIQVYPNSGQFYVEASKGSNFQMSGLNSIQVVTEQTINVNNLLTNDVSNYVPGVFVLKPSNVECVGSKKDILGN